MGCLSLSRDAHQPLQVRGFREGEPQLATVALRRGPLVAERILRHGRLVIRGQQINESEDEERSLAQAHRRRGRRLQRAALQEGCVRQCGRLRGGVSHVVTLWFKRGEWAHAGLRRQ